MSKTIILSEKQWAKLHYKISKDYPPSVLLIRNKMKSVLGFTTRTHQEWIPDGIGDYETTIHLDFYNEPKKTMFVLKYSEFLEKPSKDSTEVY